MISHVGLSELSHTTCGTQVIAQSLKTRQQNGPKLEILQSAINTCLIINTLSLWLKWEKKKKNPSWQKLRHLPENDNFYLDTWQALILPMIGLCCVKMWK